MSALRYHWVSVMVPDAFLASSWCPSPLVNREPMKIIIHIVHFISTKFIEGGVQNISVGLFTFKIVP